MSNKPPQNGKPHQDGDPKRIQAIKNMREFPPKYLLRGIIPHRQKQGEYEISGIFTNDLHDVLHTIPNFLNFDVWEVGNKLKDETEMLKDSKEFIGSEKEKRWIQYETLRKEFRDDPRMVKMEVVTPDEVPVP